MTTIPVGGTDIQEAALNHSAAAWLMAHHYLVRRLTERLGHTWIDERDAAIFLMNHVVTRRHGQLNSWFLGRLMTDPALRADVMDILDESGIFDGSDIPSFLVIDDSEYDEDLLPDHVRWLITGAKRRATRRRFKRWLKGALLGTVVTDRIDLLGGVRGRTDGEDDPIDTIWESLPVPMCHDQWVQDQFRRPEPAPPRGLSPNDLAKFPRFGGAVDTEWLIQIMEFAAFLYDLKEEDGLDIDMASLELDFQPVRADDRSDDELIQQLRDQFVKQYGKYGVNGDGLDLGKYLQTLEVFRRQYMSCTMMVGDLQVVFVNAPAVVRGSDIPRPTSTSATEYWLRFFAPDPNEDTYLMAIAGPTHGRVIHALEKVVHAARPNTTVYGVWDAAGDRRDELAPNALGELVWWTVKGVEEKEGIELPRLA